MLASVFGFGEILQNVHHHVNWKLCQKNIGSVLSRHKKSDIRSGYSRWNPPSISVMKTARRGMPWLWKTFCLTTKEQTKAENDHCLTRWQNIFMQSTLWMKGSFPNPMPFLIIFFLGVFCHCMPCLLNYSVTIPELEHAQFTAQVLFLFSFGCYQCAQAHWSNTAKKQTMWDYTCTSSTYFAQRFTDALLHSCALVKHA